MQQNQHSLLVDNLIKYNIATNIPMYDFETLCEYFLMVSAALCARRLVKIKGEAKRRREAREWQDHLYEVERERRVEATAKQFPEWNVGLYSDCRVELALVTLRTGICL